MFTCEGVFVDVLWALGFMSACLVQQEGHVELWVAEKKVRGLCRTWGEGLRALPVLALSRGTGPGDGRATQTWRTFR